MANPRSKVRSADTSRFAMVPRPDVPRSAFDIEHTHKTTFPSGRLVPVYVDEVLPGDSKRLRMHAFARLATAVTPVMDNLYLESFFFFVPNRLLWSNWERFMGERTAITDTTQFVVPQVTLTQANLMNDATLWSYFGIRAADNAPVANVQVNALPFRAYNLIWNDWFRDQDLQDPLFTPLDDGPDASTNYELRRRGKRFDYFTAARPWPQKPINAASLSGTSEAMIPGGNMLLPQAGAPVSGLGVISGQGPNLNTTGYRETGGRITSGEAYGEEATQWMMRTQPPSGLGTQAWPNVRVLVNDIRTANAVQIMMEKNARGGTRYTEIVRSHFGVLSPDARLQRPEYLGGGRTMINVSAIAQTSASAITGSTTVLGELSGIGTAVASNHGFSSSFTEHGYILGLVQVRTDLSYQQGVDRMWWRRTQFDFYWPSLAHLGDQAILSRELFLTGAAADNDVFGYIGRFDEYRYKPNRISGQFRSQAATSLDFWHFAQEFSARPTLGNTFIEDRPPLDRVLQVSGDEYTQVLFDSLFEVRNVRCMPMFAIPGLGPRL